MKKLVKNNGLVTLLLIAAIALLIFSGVQTSRAALTYVSENYTAQVDTTSMSVALVENGNEAKGVLLSNLTADGKSPVPGKSYGCKLSVKNTGTMDSFVRVIVYKYWTNGQGKRVDLSPELIKLSIGDGWVVDTKASTEEMTVIYHPAKLAAGEVCEPFITAVTLDNSLEQMVKLNTDKSNAEYEVYEFIYNGVKFAIEAEVNAVQTHNAKTAIKSAWGINVDATDDSFTLK